MAKTKYAQKSSQSAKSVPKTTGQGKANKQVKKERGAVLSVVLGLILVHSILTTYLVYTSIKTEFAGQTNGILTGLILMNIANIVAGVAMWYWKQWGIYLYAIAAVAAMAFHMVMTGSIMVAFYDLLPVAILAYILSLQHKRPLFG